MPLTHPLTQQIASIGHQLKQALDDAIPKAGTVEFQSAVAAAMKTSLAALEGTGIVGWDNKQPSSDFWDAAAELLNHGTLQVHARTKPGGYPGDFRLLEKICQQGASTDHPLGHAMDVFFQEQAAPSAVRNRCGEVANRIQSLATAVGSAYSITSVGSGPAWDIRSALGSLDKLARQRLTIQLLDMDPYALEFCEQQLHPLLNVEQLLTTRVSLNRVDRVEKALSRARPANLMYCLGFFDYLPEDEAVELLKCLWRYVAPGGELLVFNFSQNNPSRSYMEWFGNWYLVYRSPDCLNALAERAGLSDAEISVKTEATGVNLYLQATKNVG